MMKHFNKLNVLDKSSLTSSRLHTHSSTDEGVNHARETGSLSKAYSPLYLLSHRQSCKTLSSFLSANWLMQRTREDTLKGKGGGQNVWQRLSNVLLLLFPGVPVECA